MLYAFMLMIITFNGPDRIEKIEFSYVATHDACQTVADHLSLFNAHNHIEATCWSTGLGVITTH